MLHKEHKEKDNGPCCQCLANKTAVAAVDVVVVLGFYGQSTQFMSFRALCYPYHTATGDVEIYLGDVCITYRIFTYYIILFSWDEQMTLNELQVSSFHIFNFRC